MTEIFTGSDKKLKVYLPYEASWLGCISNRWYSVVVFQLKIENAFKWVKLRVVPQKLAGRPAILYFMVLREYSGAMVASALVVYRADAPDLFHLKSSWRE
jgi:hypothetical protein